MTACLAALMLTVAVLVALVTAVGTRHRAEHAADLAALAGAASLQRGADACSAAERVATANGATLISCRPVAADDVLVTVGCSLPRPLARWVPGRSVAQARAGPAAQPGS